MNGNPATLKEALYRTIHHNKKSVEAIAEELAMTPSYLARAALPDEDMLGKDNPQATGVRFPLKQLVPLIRATDDRQVLDYIANSIGCMVIEVPRRVADLSTIQVEAMNSAKEFGELMGEVATSCRENNLNRTMRERIHKEGWEAIVAIMRVIVGCEEGAPCRR